jgi:hypothetical protein
MHTSNTPDHRTEYRLLRAEPGCSDPELRQAFMEIIERWPGPVSERAAQAYLTIAGSRMRHAATLTNNGETSFTADLASVEKTLASLRKNPLFC